MAVPQGEERREFRTASGNFIVYSGTGANEGQGTYCVGTHDPALHQCIATHQTRLDQVFQFQQIALASQITDTTTIALDANEFLIPQVVEVRSPVPNAAAWSYRLDEFYRVTQVRVANDAAIGSAQLGSRDPDTELISAIFMYLGCHISYDIDLTYPTDAQLPAAGAMEDGYSQRCHHRFRPQRMMLTWRIRGSDAGTTCSNFATQALNQPLIHGNQQGITTTRWIAYLILKDVNWKQGEDPRKLVLGQHVWDRLLDVATADTAVTQATGIAGCLNDNGHFANFPSVRLLPNFAGAFLTTQDNQWCLQVVSSNPTTVQFTTNAQNCARWTRAANGNVLIGNTCLPGAGGCAVLHYLNPRQAPDAATPDNTDVTRTGPQDRLYIENLVTAYLSTTNGAQCLTKGTGAVPIAPVTWAAATPLTNCLKIRVSYYPLGPVH